MLYKRGLMVVILGLLFGLVYSYMCAFAIPISIIFKHFSTAVTIDCTAILHISHLE